jgi:PKHD-type hydroxylase
MAYQSIWYYTDIPEKVVNLIEEDLSEKFEGQMQDSTLAGNTSNLDKRNSQNAWIPTDHWVGGFIWHYIQRANRENFLYDIDCIDNEHMQFTRYTEGMFYGWHSDGGLSSQYSPQARSSGDISKNEDQRNLATSDFINTNIEKVRKLSFAIQLSDSDDYEGGNVQLISEEGKPYNVPRKKGTIVLFDSRTVHRVLKIKSGVRKSLVGWVVGPRWK